MLSDYDEEAMKAEAAKNAGKKPAEGEAGEAVAAPEGDGSGAADASAGEAEPAQELEKAADASVQENQDTPQQGCHRILVVEDARILRKMLVKILHDAGHVCDEAAQGYEGLAYLRRSKATAHPYDVVITDLMMPEMDGWEFIDNMIEKKYHPAVPIIIITANATLDAVKRSGRLGIKNFIVKPFEASRVLETLKKAIERHHSA